MDETNESGGIGMLSLLGCPIGLALLLVMTIVVIVVGTAIVAFAFGG